MRMKTKLTLMLALLALCSSGTRAASNDLPELTSDPSSPKYFTIKSFSRGGFLTSNGAGQGMTHVNFVDGSIWYFTAADGNTTGDATGGVIAHNYDGTKMTTSWTTAATGETIYILPNGINTEGVSICKASSITDYSCMDANNGNTGVGSWAPYSNDWKGTTWVIEPVVPNGYYYFKGMDTNRYPYLYSDFVVKGENNTFHHSLPNSPSNGHIWKVTLSSTITGSSYDGATTTVSLTAVNGEGLPLTIDNTEYQTLTIGSRAASLDFYFTEAINLTNWGNDTKLTTWAGFPNATDNHWTFEDVDVSAGVYNVVISGNNAGYVTYNGQNAKNGGFFVAGTITEGDITVAEIEGYTTTATISERTITVNYQLSNAKTIQYTYIDGNGGRYSGTYEAIWNGDLTQEPPTFSGVYGATITDKTFAESEGTYTFTANITFPFPVSSNGVNNATALRSALGNSIWFATTDNKAKANNSANTVVYDMRADYYRWYIIPTFDSESSTFYFSLYNVGAGKYIPTLSVGSPSSECTLSDTPGMYCYSHYNQGEGFNTSSTSTNYLTINTSGTNQNIWVWNGGTASATHRGSAMDFPVLEDLNVIITVDEAFNTLKNTSKFDILAGSTVMGPAEFASPVDINNAIDAAQEVEDNAEAKLAFIEGANGSKILNYLNMVAAYGALANIQIDMKREYGTMILPCPSTRISGLDIYSCSGKEGNVLTLTPVEGNYTKDTPYIIHAEAGRKFTIIGWDKGSTATHTNGWLTGTLNDETEIPDGSYMLATNKTTGVQAFHKVSGTGVKCAKNKCYLTPEVGGEVKAFFFNEEDIETAITLSVEELTEDGYIYNLAGQRISKAQKGINIINGKKIIK